MMAGLFDQNPADEAEQRRNALANGLRGIWNGGAPARQQLMGLLSGDSPFYEAETWKKAGRGLLGLDLTPEQRAQKVKATVEKLKNPNDKDMRDSLNMALDIMPVMATVYHGSPRKFAKRPTNAAGEIIPPTKYELAHEEAQRKAVEMLGLPPNNTAMDRARAMGFDTPAYHGTTSDFEAFKDSKIGRFDPGYKGRGHSSSEFPDIASNYAKEFYGSNEPHTNGVVMPLIINKGKNFDYRKDTIPESLFNAPGADVPKSVLSDDSFALFGINNAESEALKAPEAIRKYGPAAFSNALKKMGFTSSSDGRLETLILDPNNIRSRFAAFDPSKRDSADLLAGVAPYALPAGLAGLLGLSMPDEAAANDKKRPTKSESKK